MDKLQENCSETRRRLYVKPQIEHIRLDNEISMVMDSVPPPPEGTENPEPYSGIPGVSSFSGKP